MVWNSIPDGACEYARCATGARLRADADALVRESQAARVLRRQLQAQQTATFERAWQAVMAARGGHEHA